MTTSIQSLIPSPTKEYVEARGGYWIGAFTWPMSLEDDAASVSVKTPDGHMRHSWVSHATKMVRIYTLPEKRSGKAIAGPRPIKTPDYAGGK